MCDLHHDRSKSKQLKRFSAACQMEQTNGATWRTMEMVNPESRGHWIGGAIICTVAYFQSTPVYRFNQWPCTSRFPKPSALNYNRCRWWSEICARPDHVNLVFLRVLSRLTSFRAGKTAVHNCKWCRELCRIVFFIFFAAVDIRYPFANRRFVEIIRCALCAYNSGNGEQSTSLVHSLANVVPVSVHAARKWKRLLSSTFHRRNFLRPLHGILRFVPWKLWERERRKSSTYGARERNRPPLLFVPPCVLDGCYGSLADNLF